MRFIEVYLRRLCAYCLHRSGGAQRYRLSYDMADRGRKFAEKPGFCCHRRHSPVARLSRAGVAGNGTRREPILVWVLSGLVLRSHARSLLRSVVDVVVFWVFPRAGVGIKQGVR